MADMTLSRDMSSNEHEMNSAKDKAQINLDKIEKGALRLACGATYRFILTYSIKILNDNL